MKDVLSRIFLVHLVKHNQAQVAESHEFSGAASRGLSRHRDRGERQSKTQLLFQELLSPSLRSLSASIVRFMLQAAACEGCPNQSICASAGPAAPDPDVELIARNLDGVKNIVLVLSGKVNSYFKT